MPEALARADYDFTLSEDAPRKRRARPRNAARIEPTVTRVPQMQAGGTPKSSKGASSFLRALVRRPLRTLVSLACGAILVSFFSNVLFMQEGPHPAPLFAKQDAPASAPAQPAAQSRQASDSLPASIPPSRQTAAAPTSTPALAAPTPEPDSAPLPPPAPRSAPVSIVTAPPAKPFAPQKPAARSQPDFDPIAQFLRTGVPSGPATTASTNPSDAAETKRVAAAQRALAKLGHKLEVDGILGPGTRAAIQKFQRDQKLPGDGDLNARTLKALSARSSIAIP